MTESVSVGSSAHKIDKLVGQENFTIWRTRMIDILVDLGYYDVIDGTSTMPDETSDADGHRKWKNTDRKALSAIRLHCSDSIAVQLTRFTTSKSCWDNLDTLYQSTSLLGLIATRNKFFRTEMCEDQMLDVHMRDLRIAMDELIVLGETIGELDYALQLVGSLPPTWQSFLGTISWCLDRKDSAKAKEFAEDLVTCIMDEDQHRSNTLTTPTETALLARSADKSNIECYNCKKKGHTKAECWTKGGGSEGKGGNGGNNGGNGG
ncbi:hypothetical protein OPQ81_011080 [Rhizoctonia solani]|nr:hypothetical protein OPQ81_011080 [Rhizoctonia solani]